MNMPGDVTMGELWRNIESLRLESNRRFDDLNNTLGSKVLSVDLFTLAHSEVVGDIQELKDERLRTQSFRRNMVVALLGSVGASFTALIVELVRIHS